MFTPVRLGLLTPSSNTCLEPVTTAFLTSLGADVSAHFSRFPVTEIGLGMTQSAQFDFEPMLAAARLLADAQVSAIAWAGTSGSWLGIERDRQLCAELEAQTGVPATTSSLAMLDALSAYGVRRYGLAVPYTDDVAARIVETYGTLGLECAQRVALGITRNFDFNQLDPGAIEALVRLAAQDSDAVAVVCTNVRAGPQIESLERDLGVVIIDSVLATVWKLLELSVGAVSVLKWGELALNGSLRYRLERLLAELRGATAASRTTIRLDLPARGIGVDRVAAEALAPGVKSIRHDDSLDQWAMPTVQWIAREQRTLVQGDFLSPGPSVSPALIQVYGVRGQMLAPLVHDGQMYGWISVHEVGHARHWNEAEICALERTARAAHRIVVAQPAGREVPARAQ